MTKETFRLSKLYGKGKKRELEEEEREERDRSDQQGEVSKHLSKISS